MLGVAVNSVAVILGTIIGLIMKKGISKKMSDAVMIGVGLCVVYIGVGGLIFEGNTEAISLAVIVSIVLGAVFGTAVDIDRALNRLGEKISEKTKRTDDSVGSVADGFVNATLLFSVGAMAIMGSLSSGLRGDHTTLYIKSVLDFTAAIMLTSTFGWGVALSAIPLTIYQGSIALGAGFLSPLLNPPATNTITCTGSIIIIGLALNLIGITKIKVANYLPAIIISPFFYYLFEYLLRFVR